MDPARTCTGHSINAKMRLQPRPQKSYADKELRGCEEHPSFREDHCRYDTRLPSIHLGLTVSDDLVQTLDKIRAKLPEQVLAQIGIRRSAAAKTPQYNRLLRHLLVRPTATWLLASIWLPDIVGRYIKNLAVPVGSNMRHIEGHVVYVDGLTQGSVGFKLCATTISALVDYNKQVWCCTRMAWYTEAYIRDEQERFVCALERMVIMVHIDALQYLRRNGSGELVGIVSASVRDDLLKVLNRFLPAPAGCIRNFDSGSVVRIAGS